MSKRSKIYVAGHTGLLGTALMERLASSGYTNVVTSPHTSLDLTVQAEVDAFFSRERPECVFLCAGLTGGIMANSMRPADFFHTNMAIQENVFMSARRYGTERVVFYASSCVYPKRCAQPIREEYLMTGETEPTSEAYAAAKTAGIIACRASNAQDRTNRFIALVPNSMYGPRDNYDPEAAHVLSALIRRFVDAVETGAAKLVLWGDGRPMREFISAADVAAASVFAVENAGRLRNTHYNVGTGVELSIRELAGIIAGICGFRGRIEWDDSRPGGTQRKLLDSSRFMRLGWRPAVSLEDGVRDALRWYMENRFVERRAACP